MTSSLASWRRNFRSNGARAVAFDVVLEIAVVNWARKCHCGINCLNSAATKWPACSPTASLIGPR